MVDLLGKNDCSARQGTCNSLSPRPLVSGFPIFLVECNMLDCIISSSLIRDAALLSGPTDT
jgi:hypothetical protein